MSYNDKKFLDVNGLKHLISILDDYPTNEVLGTVINAIESEIPTNVSQLQNDAGYLTTHQDISGKANNADLAAVATSGSYNDLSNKPTIPDIQIEGYSIVENGVANIPHGSDSQLGVIRTDARYGIAGSSSGVPQLSKASSLKIKEGTDEYRPIVPENQHESAFYGLSKAAGVDLANEEVTLGTYTETAKTAIRSLIGAGTSNISDAVIGLTTANSRQSIVVDNIIRISTAFTVNGSQELILRSPSLITIKSGTSGAWGITPDMQHYSTFYGLAKAAGADEKDSTLSVGTYTETAKTAIRSMIGAAAASDVTVSDVQVNGTSIVQNNIANVPVAGVTTYGVIKSDAPYGVYVRSDGYLQISSCTSDVVKDGTNNYRTIRPSNQHESTFYGLAKVAGSDEKNSTLPVGTYTETAKSAIRNMLGAASTSIVAVQDEQPTDTDTKVWLPETQAAGVEVPTYAEFTAGLATKVGFTDYATSSTAGVMKVNDKGVKIENGELAIRGAGSSAMKAGTNDASVITPWGQHQAAFYGLAKAAGADLASAENITVGTYPTTASAAIRSMLGAVGDVQVNGTSVVSNGTAEIPTANNIRYGVVKVNTADGVYITGDGTLAPTQATDANYHDGISNYRVVTPYGQHQAVFYGLAKAAGDATQSASSNAVGTYTTEAKSAIQSMLGIDLQSIASEVEIPLVETVSGTTPSITGQPNTRYVCGEVSTLSITPPSAGSIDVIFDSGSTPAVITVPNTVRWPAWFDATALEADTTYEILITDGVYGSVMTWAN